MRYPLLRALAAPFLAALCLAAPASAATYTLSPSGSDSNDGLSAPFLTVPKAISALKSGDTLLFQPGTYTGGAYLTVSNVTLRANGDVTLAGAVSARVDAISLYQVSNVVVDGFKITNAPRCGVFCVLSDHVTIQNCNISYAGVTSIVTGNTSDLLIQNNVCSYSKNEHGIYASQSGDRIRILNNQIVGNNRSGLQVNAVEDVPNAGAPPSSDSISHNCLIAGNVMTGNCKIGGASINCMGLQDSVVVNNLAYRDGIGGGIALWDDGAGAAFASKNNQIYHNTLVFPAGAGLYGVQCLAGSTGNVIKNNVLVVNAGPGLDLSEAVQSNCNLFGGSAGSNVANGSSLAAWRNSTGNDQNSQVGDPQLDATYRPQAGSPCLDGGEQVYPTDLIGTLRPQGAGPDIGCYEVVASGGTGGGTPTALPAPAGLTAKGANGQVSLAWSAVSGATGYDLFRSASQSGVYSKVLSSAGPSCTDTAVSNGTTYWYQVCTVNAAGDGAPSAAVSGTPQAPAAAYSLSGTVSLHGAGLSGATVSAGGQAVVSNASGQYTLAGLPAGSYAITCSLSGYTFSGPASVTVSATVGGVNFAAAVTPPAATGSIIYDDALAGGWTASKSKATYSLANQTPVQSGSASIALAITGADGYLQLAGSGLSTTGKTVLRFAVHGGKKGGQYLRVRAGVNGVEQPSVNLWSYGGAPQAGQWVEYAVPLAALKAAGGSLTNLRFTAGAATAAAYIDNIRLE